MTTTTAQPTRLRDDRARADGDQRTRTTRPWWVPVALLALAVAVWLALPTLSASGGALRRVAPAWLAAAAVAEVVALAALAQVYRAGVRAFGFDPGYRRALSTSMGAYTVSRVFPGGGAVGVAFAARRMTHFGAAGATATAGVVLAGTVAMGTLCTIVTAAGAALWATGTIGGAGALLTAAPLLVVAAGAGLVAATRRSPAGSWLRARSAAWCDRLHIDTGRWAQVRAALTGHGGVRRAIPIAGWSAVNWLVDAAALWLVLAGLGAPVTPAVLLAGYGAANLVTALPITPGGLGVVEAGTAGAFTALGVPPAVAVLAVIVYRVMSFWLPVAAGTVPYLHAVRTEQQRG